MDAGAARLARSEHDRPLSRAHRRAAAPASAAAAAAEAAARSEKLLASLAKYLEHCGGSAEMITGWYTKTEFRKNGATAGTYDSYFFNTQVSGSAAPSGARRHRAHSPRAHSPAGQC